LLKLTAEIDWLVFVEGMAVVPLCFDFTLLYSITCHDTLGLAPAVFKLSRRFVGDVISAPTNEFAGEVEGENKLTITTDFVKSTADIAMSVVVSVNVFSPLWILFTLLPPPLSGIGRGKVLNV